MKRSVSSRAARVLMTTKAAMTVGATVWLIALMAVVGGDVRGRAQTPTYSQDESDYGYGNGYLTDVQRAGRDTWYFWTGGNEKFWVKMAELTEGNVNLLAYVDSRLHDRRFAIARRHHAARMSRGDGGRRVRPVDGSVRAAGRARRARRSVRHRRTAAIPESELRQGELECRELFQEPGEDAAAVPHRHGVRLLPRRLQPAEPAGERRSAEVEQSCRRHR